MEPLEAIAFLYDFNDASEGEHLSGCMVKFFHPGMPVNQRSYFRLLIIPNREVELENGTAQVNGDGNPESHHTEKYVSVDIGLISTDRLTLFADYTVSVVDEDSMENVFETTRRGRFDNEHNHHGGFRYFISHLHLCELGINNCLLIKLRLFNFDIDNPRLYESFALVVRFPVHDAEVELQNRAGIMTTSAVIDSSFPTATAGTSSRGNTFNTPQVRLLTTADRSVCTDPNLYANGKFCLSLPVTGPAWSPALNITSLHISTDPSLMKDCLYRKVPGLDNIPADRPECVKYNLWIQHETVRVAVLKVIEEALGNRAAFWSVFVCPDGDGKTRPTGESHSVHKISSQSESVEGENMECSLPSFHIDSQWLEVRHDDKAFPEADGKWMFFPPEHSIDDRWNAAKELYSRGNLPGISFVKVSTAMPVSHHAEKYVILFIYGPSTDELMMKIGRKFISVFPPTSEFVYYKSDEQSKRSLRGKDETTSSGTRGKNYLYRLRCAPITPIEMWKEDGQAEVQPEVEKRAETKDSPRKRLPAKNNWKNVSGLIFVFDTETTGFPPSASPTETDAWDRCRLMEIAGHVYKSSGEVVSKGEYIVKPEFTFDFHGMPKVHGKRKSEGVTLNCVLDELNNAFSGVEVLVGRNVQFDFRVVLSEIARKNRTDFYELFESLETCCTMKMGKELMSIHTNQKLSVLYEDLFGYPPERVLHGAETDVLSCTEVYFRWKSLADGTEELDVEPAVDRKRVSFAGRKVAEPGVDGNVPAIVEERYSAFEIVMMFILAVFMLQSFWSRLVSALL